jgi:hypothetical protein
MEELVADQRLRVAALTGPQATKALELLTAFEAALASVRRLLDARRRERGAENDPAH